MDIGKLALALAGLVIIGLIIFAVIKFVLPAAFAYVGCVIKIFLSPSGDATTMGTCADTFAGSFLKFNTNS